MATPTNANESYCTFTLASDVTAGGLPSEDEIAKDLESSDDSVSTNERIQGTRIISAVDTLGMTLAKSPPHTHSYLLDV